MTDRVHRLVHGSAVLGPQADQASAKKQPLQHLAVQHARNIVTFEDDAGAYDQHDAEGFIKLQALRLRLGKMD